MGLLLWFLFYSSLFILFYFFLLKKETWVGVFIIFFDKAQASPMFPSPALFCFVLFFFRQFFPWNLKSSIVPFILFYFIFLASFSSCGWGAPKVLLGNRAQGLGQKFC